MKEAVIMKSNRYGIQLHLDPELEFEELLGRILDKFTESEKFFRDASFAISFEGRELSEEEENRIVETINEKTTTHVICIVAEDEIREEILKMKTESALKEAAPPEDTFNPREAELRVGDVKDGEMLITEQNLVVYGNVPSGATVTSKGSIFVLGELGGKVWAGSDGREDAVVFALKLHPESLRIGPMVYAPESEEGGFFASLRGKKKHVGAHVAKIRNGMVVSEPLE